MLVLRSELIEIHAEGLDRGIAVAKLECEIFGAGTFFLDRGREAGDLLCESRPLALARYLGLGE